MTCCATTPRHAPRTGFTEPEHTAAGWAPVGLDGQPVQAVLARGNIWVAAGNVVDRVSLATGRRETITLPKGMNATGIAVDPLNNTVWVANSSAIGTT